MIPGFIIHGVLAVIAIVLVLRDRLSSPGQKGLQILLCVLVPFLGPILVGFMKLYQSSAVSPRKNSIGDSAEDHVRKFHFWS